MVEMRWYRDEEMAAGGCKPKLQYRYYKTFDFYPEGKGTFKYQLADWAMEWSEWMDVPEVTEGSQFDIPEPR